MQRFLATIVAVFYAVAPSSAQVARLVRCTATADVACLSVTGSAIPAQSSLGGHDLRVLGAVPMPLGARVVMVADPTQLGGLGRGALTGQIAYPANSVATRWLWRPPVIAPVMFRGVADSAAVSRDVADAMGTSTASEATRPIIAAMVFLLLAVVALFLPRLVWGDPAGLPPAPRVRIATTTVANPPAREARSPDDITLQTARRTALGR